MKRSAGDDIRQQVRFVRKLEHENGMTTNTRKQKEKMETQSAITVCHHPQIFVL
jgi:hypothetical protein